MTQQQIFTKDFIYDRIKDSGFPCWSLSMQNGFRNFANVMSYYGIDWSDEDNDETKIEKSIARLEQTLSTFPPDTSFAIEIKSGRNATGSAILGPFYFSITGQKEQSPDGQPEAAQPQPSTLGVVPPGYVPESTLKGLEESLNRNFNAKIEALQADFDRKQREAEFSRREKELDEREKELKELKKEYDSSVAKATDVLFGVGKKIFTSFFMPQGAQGAAQLGAMQTAQTQQPEEPDEKADAVDDVAAFLYQNFTIDEIRNFKHKIQDERTEMA